ncbi:MAG: carbonic anhydrase family protein [Pseudomonadota bacterium]|nr:carbonic anhydrase family protein [Pseudomonadota bacterium]
MLFRFASYKTAAAAALVLSSWAAQAEGQGPHWTYQGHHGAPERWAGLDPAFETCAKGLKQSPIDIRNTVRTALAPLEFGYTRAAPVIVNNGHTVQVNLPAGQTLKIGEQTYELLQFHFHTPSEETIAGKHAAMVAHFVHRNAAGELGVVGVLLEHGKKHAAFDAIFSRLPRPGETIAVEGLTLDLAALLPADKGYYAYDGSLTTPPCSQGVRWMVLKTPVKLGVDQIKAFRRLFSANARPLQPLNGRIVRESL